MKDKELPRMPRIKNIRLFGPDDPDVLFHYHKNRDTSQIRQQEVKCQNCGNLKTQLYGISYYEFEGGNLTLVYRCPRCKKWLYREIHSETVLQVGEKDG